MDLNLIKKLVKIVDSTEITDLEIEEEGLRIKIAKKIRNSQFITQPQIMAASNPQTASAVSETNAEESEESKNKKSNLHEIHSPIVGTFYRAPAPDADPYIQIGDTISAGSVLCIIEAMKLMNEIESDVSGKVVKVLTENGKPVEYNQPLFLIELS